MATKPKATAQAEPTSTKSIMVPVTPKKRVKNPPPTLTEMASAVRARREGLIQFSALIVQLDNLRRAGHGPNDKEVKVNRRERRELKADIRRSIKVIRRYERALVKGETIVKG